MKQGQLVVESIKASDLVGGDYIGKQDPYIVLSLNDWSAKTLTKDSAGRNALWEKITDMEGNIIDIIDIY